VNINPTTFYYNRCYMNIKSHVNLMKTTLKDTYRVFGHIKFGWNRIDFYGNFNNGFYLDRSCRPLDFRIDIKDDDVYIGANHDYHYKY
jgi:hypothetical protein